MEKIYVFHKLREAVVAERLYSLATPEFSALLIKMVEYAERKGPAPSITDFLVWRYSIDAQQEVGPSDFRSLG